MAELARPSTPPAIGEESLDQLDEHAKQLEQYRIRLEREVRVAEEMAKIDELLARRSSLRPSGPPSSNETAPESLPIPPPPRAPMPSTPFPLTVRVEAVPPSKPPRAIPSAPPSSVSPRPVTIPPPASAPSASAPAALPLYAEDGVAENTFSAVVTNRPQPSRLYDAVANPEPRAGSIPSFNREKSVSFGSVGIAVAAAAVVCIAMFATGTGVPATSAASAGPSPAPTLGAVQVLTAEPKTLCPPPAPVAPIAPIAEPVAEAAPIAAPIRALAHPSRAGRSPAKLALAPETKPIAAAPPPAPAAAPETAPAAAPVQTATKRSMDQAAITAEMLRIQLGESR